MDTILTQEERDNKKRGVRTSVIVHIGLILLALLPLTQYQDPPPGQEGIMVNLGIPDVGEGDENAAAEEEVVEETEEVQKVEEEEVEEQEEVEEVISDPEPVREKEIVKTEDPEAIALKRKKEKEAKENRAEDAKKKKAADAKKKKAADAKAAAAAKAKAAADAKAAAAAKAKAAADAKSKYGGLADGLGKGKGNTGKAGNQGDPNGDPDSNILTGVSTGSGKVGGGLGSRGRVKSPPVQEKSQAAGTIRLNVCVDSNGNVISASYTQKGSTTANSTLKKAAIRNAKKWKFSKGGPDKQCGTITYRFKVQ